MTRFPLGLKIDIAHTIKCITKHKRFALLAEIQFWGDGQAICLYSDCRATGRWERIRVPTDNNGRPKRKDRLPKNIEWSTVRISKRATGKIHYFGNGRLACGCRFNPDRVRPAKGPKYSDRRRCQTCVAVVDQ